MLEALAPEQQDIFLKTIAASFDLEMVRRHRGRQIRQLFAIGNGNNGKDALREVVKLMYGREAIADVSLGDFKIYDEGKQFSLSRLLHAKVNWASENKMVSIDNLQSWKRYATGEELNYELKNVHQTSFLPKGIGIYNVNRAPDLMASSEAIKSGVAVIPFTKTFVEGADPTNNEIEADPRFRYDPDFLITEVLPAFLNRVLRALESLMKDGIDYSSTEKALEEIQVKNSHLFQFCKDTGLIYKAQASVSAKELWNRLENWYINNGTLTIETLAGGKKQRHWQDQVNPHDRNVKGPNQVIERLLQLFPKADKSHLGNNRQGISGLAFTSAISTISQNTGEIVELEPEN
ncbi:MAG: hypothetical protein NW220_18405 [Leptolyngbyaceae cyanobacterium bins.349]|nr:hypothetical protein [Leptolyngbyaceae cyanobacterium bins.349]